MSVIARISRFAFINWYLVRKDGGLTRTLTISALLMLSPILGRLPVQCAR
jgi:hypothetical protein